MNKNLKLSCRITTSDTPGMHTVTGSLYDGTPFSIKVQEHHTLPNAPVREGESIEGFLRVEHVGEQGNRAIVVLPAPSLEFGKNITVNTLWLSPMDVSIKNFIRQPATSGPVKL